MDISLNIRILTASTLMTAMATFSCGSEETRAKNGGSAPAGKSGGTGGITTDTTTSNEEESQEEESSATNEDISSSELTECTEDKNIKVSNNYGFKPNCKRLSLFSDTNFTVKITGSDDEGDNGRISIMWFGEDEKPQTNRDYLLEDKNAKGSHKAVAFFNSTNNDVASTTSSRVRFKKAPTKEDQTYEIEFDFEQNFPSNPTAKQSFSGSISAK